MSIRYILIRLNDSPYFQALNVTMKRKISFNYVRKLFKDNDMFNDDYMEVIDRTVNKVRLHKSNLLKNWKLIVNEDSETKEYNEVLDSITTDTPLNATDTTNNPINSPTFISPSSINPTSTSTSTN